MKTILFLLAVLALASSLYTSSMVRAKYNSTLLQAERNAVPKITLTTTCSIVNLATYNYSGIVRSGYLTVGKGNSALGFIFYGKSDVTDVKALANIPTIIWLNGGPGSSSQLGNFNELGPLWVLKKIFGVGVYVQKNNFAWTNNYNVLFVDQPVGTGLSYADPEYKDPFVHSMDDVAVDFYNALNELYNNPNGCFSSSHLGIPPTAPLYIFGESYAGKYAPAIGAYITKQKLDNNGFLKGLKGVGIGDGFTEPYSILSEVGNFAYSLSLLDYQERASVEQMLINATINLENRNWDGLHDSFDDTLDYIVEKAGNVNVYDITKNGDYDDTVNTYLHMPEIVAMYNLNPQIKFGMQGDQVYFNLYTDFMKPYVDRVEYLLSKKVPVIVYNGQDDLIVETPGTMRWIDRVAFPEAEEFRQKLLVPWKYNGKVVGAMKSAGLLQFRVVNKAGHLVPMDQPENSLQMVKEFVASAQMSEVMAAQ